MQIKIAVRHGHLSDSVQELIRQKAEKLPHLFERLTMIEVTVDLKHEHSKQVEFVVQAEHKHDFVARETNGDVMAAVDLALAKLESQLRRYKERIQNHRGTPSARDVAAPRPRAPARNSGGAGMRMSDFVVRDAIIPALAASTKEGVIREMVESLRSAGQFPGADLEDVVRHIMKRELLGSTGIGRGVAIPHTKHQSVERCVGTVAVSTNGVAFESLDGEAALVFVLLISPQDRPGDHLRALENVSRRLRDEGFIQALEHAKTREEIWSLLERADVQPG